MSSAVLDTFTLMRLEYVFHLAEKGESGSRGPIGEKGAKGEAGIGPAGKEGKTGLKGKAQFFYVLLIALILFPFKTLFISIVEITVRKGRDTYAREQVPLMPAGNSLLSIENRQFFISLLSPLYFDGVACLPWGGGAAEILGEHVAYLCFIAVFILHFK